MFGEREVDDVFRHQLYYSMVGSPYVLAPEFTRTLGEKYWTFLRCTSAGEGNGGGFSLSTLRRNAIALSRDGRASLAELIYLQAYREALPRVEAELGL